MKGVCPSTGVVMISRIVRCMVSIGAEGLPTFRDAETLNIIRRIPLHTIADLQYEAYRAAAVHLPLPS